MRQPYIEPEAQAYSIELEKGVLAGGSNEGFNDVTPGTWDPITTSSLDDFLSSE